MSTDPYTYKLPSGGAQAVNGLDPTDAISHENQLIDTYNDEFQNFLLMAKKNPWMAIQYFMFTMSNQLLEVQGAEMNVQSSIMNVVAQLNGDLTKLNSDVNNIFQLIQESGSDGTSEPSNEEQIDKAVQQFLDDGYQFYSDFSSEFGMTDNPQGLTSPLDNSELQHTMQNALDGFGTEIPYTDPASDGDLYDFFSDIYNYGTTNSAGLPLDAQQIGDYFSGGFDTNGNYDSGLFMNAYNNANGDSEKQIVDITTNVETPLNQESSTASTTLSADQQNFNSYEATLKDILSQVSQLIQGIVSQTSKSFS
ncbi:hypothetical protein [Simkania sp.]|uniref:hypothetical protein n=1 Tax=Simkania sp. TaxID=34094 RepID=UPI003B52B7FB